MTQATNEKLTVFATAVGTDIKQIKAALNDKVTQQQVTDEVQNAVRDMKNEILGGASAELDTLKEIADAMASSGRDTNAAVVQKIAEHKERLDAIEGVLATDLVATYNAAKAA